MSSSSSSSSSSIPTATLLTTARTAKNAGQWAEATTGFQEWLADARTAQDPQRIDVEFERAQCLGRQGEHKEAANVLLRLTQQPTHASAQVLLLNELGVCFNNLKQHRLAATYFQKTLDALQACGAMDLPVNRENVALCLNNLGNCQVLLRDYDSAISTYRTSLAKKKTDDALVCLADVYFFQKRYALSVQTFHRIKRLEDKPKIHYRYSFLLLVQRLFRDGFAAYESRLANNYCFITNKPARVEVPFIPRWDGVEPCARLLLLYEQGIGDNIMFFRFVLQLAEERPDMQLLYFCKPVVQHLFDLSDHPNVEIVQEVSAGVADQQAYIMSLPYLLQLRRLDPLAKPYLVRHAAREAVWAARLPPAGSVRRIGFAVQGLLTQSYLDKFLPLPAVAEAWWRDVPNTWWMCLQKPEELKGDWQSLRSDTLVFDTTLDADQPFADTVALVHQLDLIITVDTALAHLAGVAGVRTWLLLGQGSDWRWFDDTTQSSWYPSVEIFRAPHKDFASVLPLVRKRLLAEKPVSTSAGEGGL